MNTPPPFPSPPAAGYRQNQPVRPADPGAEARFQRDLEMMQKAKGWRSFLYSKDDPGARKRFFMAISIMITGASLLLRILLAAQRH